MSLNSTIFHDLFVLDLANNHQGDLNHGINIIQSASQACKTYNIKAGLKFQFRNLETFIHTDHQTNSPNKNIRRFIDTKLTLDEYSKLVDCARKNHLITVCTPFDEDSVNAILEMDIDIIKIASCSAKDGSLLQKVANINKPLIISTGGLNIDEIDKLVCFLENHNLNFALMHCVSIYPTPNNECNLNQISMLKSRYPNLTIGWSTHEIPENYDAIKIAYTLGARIFERHIGLNTDRYQLNTYSSTPSNLNKWFESYHTTKELLGGNYRKPSSPTETNALNALKRGVYAKHDIPPNHPITSNDVYFCMPLQPNQLSTDNWQNNLKSNTLILANKPVPAECQSTDGDNIRLFQYALQMKGLLNDAHVCLNEEDQIIVSHHYGLDKFREFGCIQILCINRSYCKKIMVQLPRQKHPYHYHKTKEETFRVIFGDLEIEIDGHRHNLKPGNSITVQPYQWHKFNSQHGSVFEEISTSSVPYDSFYEDPQINHADDTTRKTLIHWKTIAKHAFCGINSNTKPNFSCRPLNV